MLLCSLRELGGCPCPRCKIPLHKVPDLGTKLDAKRRLSLLRCNDTKIRDKVSLSRTFIYKQGRNVNSEAVENILKVESLTPTQVIRFSTTYKTNLIKKFLECILRFLFPVTTASKTLPP
jgi:hypothetical protein